jgi:hypothetical protein
MEGNANNDKGKITELENLVIHNPELERLEDLLDRFNIFEAMGVVRQEVRHSDFLAFLLNPKQNHGLNDLFVKRFLQTTLGFSEEDQSITPIDLDIWDLDGFEVRREWQSIDILLVDEAHQMVVAIENKVYSGEHDDQLKRYRKHIQEHFRTWDKLYIYLTPDGAQASDPNYISISYVLICELIENILESRESSLGQDVFTLMTHYAEMLRRFIVGESEIEILCRQIYKKHQKALDMIYEYRPDLQVEIFEYLVNLITGDKSFEIDRRVKSRINFIPKTWDNEILQQGEKWTPSGRMFMFEFQNSQDSLKLALILGPGPEDIRQTIFDVVSENEPPFKRSFTAIGKMWSTVFLRNILTKQSYVDKSTEETFDEINQKWSKFLEQDLQKLDEIVIPMIEDLKKNNHN